MSDEETKYVWKALFKCVKSEMCEESCEVSSSILLVKRSESPNFVGFLLRIRFGGVSVY